MAGQVARVWADGATVHVSISGQLVNCAVQPDDEDLAELRERGAVPAGPPDAHRCPVSPASHHRRGPR